MSQNVNLENTELLTADDFSEELKAQTIKDYYTPQMFGAVGDGAVDDTEAIRSCIANSNTVFIPAGNYKISDTLHISTNKHIIFDKNAYFTITSNSDGISIEGNNIKIENLHIVLTNEFRTGALHFSQSAVIFPEGVQENVTIIDPVVEGKMDVFCNTDPYSNFTTNNYEDGIGIRFYKLGGTTTNPISSYSCNIRIIRPRIKGFSCGLQLAVAPDPDANTTEIYPWVNEVYVNDAVFVRSGHALEVSSNHCSSNYFSGYVQCYDYDNNKKAQNCWSIYGGERCVYDIEYWDTSIPFFFVPSTANPIINRQVTDRARWDDFGKSVITNTKAANKGLIFSKGPCLNDYKGKITKVNYDTYNIYTPGNNLYIPFKDDLGNYLLDIKEGGQKKIEFEVSADFNCVVYGYIAPKTADYYLYDNIWFYKPNYKVVSASESTIELDNVEGLEVGDVIGVWGYPSLIYNYITSPTGFTGFAGGNNLYTIQSIDENFVTVNKAVENIDTLVGKGVSKKYKNTYELIYPGKTITANAEPIKADFSIILEDFSELIKPGYLLLGIYVLNLNGVEGNIQISDIRLTI